jgi:DNA-binding FrmR family transcriptional regulator
MLVLDDPTPVGVPDDESALWKGSSVPRKRSLDRHRSPLNAERTKALRNRLKTARGHLDHVIGALDEGAYVIDILQQLAAVRGSIDASVRVALRYYCEHGFAPALRAGAVEPALDELMSALSFLKQIG